LKHNQHKGQRQTGASTIKNSKQISPQVVREQVLLAPQKANTNTFGDTSPHFEINEMYIQLQQFKLAFDNDHKKLGKIS
jgi:hypothetical protein